MQCLEQFFIPKFAACSHQRASFLYFLLKSLWCLPLCDLYRSSICEIKLHCFPFITLFSTHWSYGFSMNPHSIILSNLSLQNSRAAGSIPYHTIVVRTKSFSFLFLHFHFLCSCGSNMMISCAIVHSNNMCILSCMLACKKVAGVLVMTRTCFWIYCTWYNHSF